MLKHIIGVSSVIGAIWPWGFKQLHMAMIENTIHIWIRKNLQQNTYSKIDALIYMNVKNV